MHLVIRYGDLALVGATGKEKKREPYPGDGHVRRFSFYRFLYYVDVFSFPSLRGIQGILVVSFLFLFGSIRYESRWNEVGCLERGGGEGGYVQRQSDEADCEQTPQSA